MQRTLSSRRQAVVLSLALVATGLMAVQPVGAQDPSPPTNTRYRVLVPSLEKKGTVRPDFGKKVADLIAKSILALPTHQPVPANEMKDALKKYKLNEADLDCIKDRQLAVQMNAELVMCGQYEQSGAGYKVAAQFISAKNGETFEVAPFDATTPEQAAQHIYSSFENYVKQISLSAFCSDYLASQQYPNALENCNQALTINPNSQIALTGKGMALYRMSMTADQSAISDTARLRESFDVYKKVIELNPVNQDALRQAGVIAARLGEADASRQYFKQYMELNPGDVGVRLAIASEASKNGDPEGALRIIEEGLQNDSANADLNAYAGHFAIAAAGKAADKEHAAPFFTLAAKYYGRVYTLKGAETDPIVLQNYILALKELGRAPEAVDIGKRAVAAKPNEAGVWMAYGNALQASGNLDEALAALDSAAARDPKTPRVAFRRAQWLLDAKRLNDAIPAFKTAIEKGDVDADLAVNLVFRQGFEQYRANNYDSALEYFAAARDLANDAKGKGMANFWSGMVFYQRGIAIAKPQTAKAARSALPLFQRALELLQSSGVEDYANATNGVKLGQTISAVKQYIDIQNQIIKRG